MQTNAKFDRCLKEVFIHEGEYANHPADRGGPTKFGITQKTLSDWRGTQATEADVRQLTRDEARLIYFSRYWNPVRGDELPPGVDLVLFDAAVHMGVGRAVRMAQRIVGASVDGVVGRQTLAAIRGFPVEELIRRFCEDRLAFLRTLPNWETFKIGWQRRVQAVERKALAMAREGLPVAEVAQTDTAKAATATAGIVTTVAVALREAEPLIAAAAPWFERYGGYGVLVAVAVVTLAGVWHWRARRG